MNVEEAVLRLKEWSEALEVGDVNTALDAHDAVTDHIKEAQDGQVIFQLAGLDPNPFIHWAGLKRTIREQLAKGPEQMEADFREAIMQIDDYVQKLGLAKSAREVMKWIAGIQESLQPCLLNASFLDREEPKEGLEEVPAAEPPKAEKPKRSRKKSPKKSPKKEKGTPTVDNPESE